MKKELDRLISLKVRYDGAWEEGGELVNRCYTCGTVKPVKQLQCSHFFSRRFLATRWDRRNLRIGCYSCNILLEGNHAIFAAKLLRENPQIIAELDSARQQLTDYDVSWYEEQIARLKDSSKDS
ncbi:MAG: hypothetical protein ACYDBV_08700 [Nitrospiria bacterium]